MLAFLRHWSTGIKFNGWVWTEGDGRASSTIFPINIIAIVYRCLMVSKGKCLWEQNWGYKEVGWCAGGPGQE